jgi:hypothetical protein
LPHENALFWGLRDEGFNGGFSWDRLQRFFAGYHWRLRNSIGSSISFQEMGTEEGALFLLRRARYIAEGAPLHAVAETDQVRAKEIAMQLDGIPRPRLH